MLDYETISDEPNAPEPIAPDEPSGPERRTIRSRVDARLDIAPWALLVQLFIGVGWLRAAIEKLVDPAWWNGSVLNEFLDANAGLALPWYQTFIDAVVTPSLALVALTVLIAQIYAAVALLTGWRMRAGLGVGVFLNLNFIAAGAVNPSIFYVIYQAALLLWLLQDATASTRWRLRLFASLSVVVALISAPYAETLDPAHVVEDPAVALVTLGLLIAIACGSGLRFSSD